MRKVLLSTFDGSMLSHVRLNASPPVCSPFIRVVVSLQPARQREGVITSCSCQVTAVRSTKLKEHRIDRVAVVDARNDASCYARERTLRRHT